MMRPGSVTHHFDFEQRYLELGITNAAVGANGRTWTLTVSPPDDATLMPPGDYMLFFRSGAMVSRAAKVRLL